MRRQARWRPASPQSTPKQRRLSRRSTAAHVVDKSALPSLPLPSIEAETRTEGRLHWTSPRHTGTHTHARRSPPRPSPHHDAMALRVRRMSQEER